MLEPVQRPTDIDNVVAEFSEGDMAWVVMDAAARGPLNVPDDRSLKTKRVHFFLSRHGAERFVEEVKRIASKVRDAVLFPLRDASAGGRRQFQPEKGTGIGPAGISVATETWGHVSPLKNRLTTCEY